MSFVVVIVTASLLFHLFRCFIERLIRYVLQKERMEAQRKEIEAEGIAKFQTIVSEGIDERLLQWKGIEATMELAKSDNAKVVIVGSQKNRLPIILGK